MPDELLARTILGRSILGRSSLACSRLTTSAARTGTASRCGLGGPRQSLLDPRATLNVCERPRSGALLTHHRVTGAAGGQVVADQRLDLRIGGGDEVVAAVLGVDGLGGEPVGPREHAGGGDECGLPRDVQDRI